MSNQPPLTDWQKAKILSVMRVGADRATACHYVGATLGQLQAEASASADFARDVLQAEAEAELKHVGNIHRASQDEKNWRTSAWWLQRRAQGRTGAATAAEALARVAELVDMLAALIVEEVPDAAVQRRLIERLLAAVDGVDDAQEAGSKIIDDTKLLEVAAPDPVSPIAEPSGSSDEEGAS
jgi:hypothetical protein